MPELIHLEDPQEKRKSYQEAAKEYEAKLDNHGPLSLTAEDHHSIGSTPPEFMDEQPERTMGELMTDEEIETWFRKNCLRKYKEPTIRYLEDLDRCEQLTKHWRQEHPS